MPVPGQKARTRAARLERPDGGAVALPEVGALALD
jgi:hypothetical protein